MDQNVIIELPGGASGAYIEDLEFVFDHNTHTYHLIATHKDTTTTNIDLGPLSIDLQVVGGLLLGNGDYQLTVVDPGGSGNVNLVIPLGNYYTKPDMDLLLDDKVDKIPGMGLSTEDFTTALMTQLSDYSATLVSAVDYDPLTEIVSVTTSGPGGLTQSDLIDLSNKVDTVAGLGLSENDFTQALNDKLDLFTVGSVASIGFNTSTNEVEFTDYNGSTFVAFQLPGITQSDWAETSATADSFILNKDIVTNAITNNTALIATNTSAIALSNAAALILGADIGANAANIVTLYTEYAAQEAVIDSHTVDLAGLHALVLAAGVAVNTSESALQLQISSNLSAITAQGLVDATHTAEIDALKSCCADETLRNDTQDTAISALEGVNLTQNTNIANNASNINTIGINLATLDGNVLAITGDVAGNTFNISTMDTILAGIIADISTLNAGIGMTPAQIIASINGHGDAHVMTDIQYTQLANLPINQGAIDAAQDAAFAAYMAQAAMDYVKIAGDTMTGDLVLPGGLAATDKTAIAADSYAQETIGGTLKVRVDTATDTLYMTTDGTNP